MTMAMGSNGVSAGNYYGVEGTPIPVLVRYDKKYGASKDDILNYPVFTARSPQPIPLRSLIKSKEVREQSLITREQLAPTLEISAFTNGRPLNFIIEDVQKEIKKITVPQGYQIVLSGEKSDLAESKHELGNAFLIALLAVYLLLVAQLRSFIHPFTIMTSIPLSLIGVFTALYIAGKTVSMPVMVGMILLAGTVVNNAIILLEFVRQARNEGIPRKQALIQSVSVRFRPIMMTSLSTIVGMIPLAAEWALGAERFSPLATAVIGGMTAATFLTMIFIPVLYDLFDDITGGIKKLFARKA
jgi:multidrug efflux pump subunit AcrB